MKRSDKLTERFCFRVSFYNKFPLLSGVRNIFLSFALCFISFFSFVSIANAQECEDAFYGSRLYFENLASRFAKSDWKLHPDFFNIREAIDSVKDWNKRLPVLALLESLFPKDVSFINHQLHRPEGPTVIKSAEIGDAVLARAHWQYKNYSFESNVAFSTRALSDNLQIHKKQNWLASERAKAVIFYFHGGGTTTTGAHTAHTMISHFKKYGIDVVALDLPWHGEGHRHLLNNFEMEIEVLGAFAQKFIPHNVPLFVAGHSWGGVFAEKIMRMSDRPKSEFSFHPKLTGSMILSTALTDLAGIRKYFKEQALAKIDAKFPEKERTIGLSKALRETELEKWEKTFPKEATVTPSLKEIQEEYYRKTTEVLTERIGEFPKDEQDIFFGMLVDGKFGLLPGLYAKIMFQMSQAMPDHKGENFIPALMVVGKHDPLVYLGFERDYEIYKDLRNVTPVYLGELPLLFNKDKQGSNRAFAWKQII